MGRLLCWLLVGGLVGGSLGESAQGTGHTLSLDVQQIEVREVLRLIAEVAQVNIIASSDVQGHLTLRLVDVPWERALDAVAKLADLRKERHGNIILIAPAARFRAYAVQQQRAQQTKAQAEPTMTRVIPLNYANAASMQAHLATLLGSCASISVDIRTNSLVVTGTPSCLRPLAGMR